MDKNKRENQTPLAENKPAGGGGGFFLNFDDAPKIDTVEKKARISIPTKVDAEELEKAKKKEEEAAAKLQAKLERQKEKREKK